MVEIERRIEMKKMLAFLLAGTMVVGSLGVTSFADEVTDTDPLVEEAIEEILEEIEDLDLTVLEDEEVEEIVEEISDDVDAEETEEEEIARNFFHNRFTDEYRKLVKERKETRRLVDSIKDKKVKISALKTQARMEGKYGKLQRAELVEKEVRVLKKAIDHLRDRKANQWDNFKTYFRAGNYTKAENTLKKIVAAKILINDNLKGINNLLTKEINVLK